MKSTDRNRRDVTPVFPYNREKGEGSGREKGGKRVPGTCEKIKTCRILQTLNSLNIWALVHW
jgi:hypothetical protein